MRNSLFLQKGWMKLESIKRLVWKKKKKKEGGLINASHRNILKTLCHGLIGVHFFSLNIGNRDTTGKLHLEKFRLFKEHEISYKLLKINNTSSSETT